MAEQKQDKKFIRLKDGNPIPGAVAFPQNAEDEATLRANGWVEAKGKKAE
jgi:hypothetical protein